MTPSKLHKIVVRDKEGRYTIYITYEDDHILVVNKPSGLLTIPDHWDKQKACLSSTLHDYLIKKNPNGRIFVVHRLDKETSGVMVFAKTAEAHRHLNGQFENRIAKKRYLALIHGHLLNETGEIDAPIGKKTVKGGRREIDFRKGMEALTRYVTVKRYKKYTLVEAFPETGRMHQIRLHFAHVGHPLAIDSLYNTEIIEGISIRDIKPRARIRHDDTNSTSYLIHRLTLHASLLQIQHPLSGELMTFNAPLPKDFRAVLKALDKWGNIPTEQGF